MQESSQDPFDLLMNASTDMSLWILIGGPLALLSIIVLVYAFLVAAKRRREREDVRQAIEDADRERTGTSVRLVPGIGQEAAEEAEPFGEEPEAEEAAVQEAPSPAAPPVAPEAPVAEPLRLDVEEVRRTDRASWLQRLKGGLAKTRDSLRGSIGSLFGAGARLDADVLERLHEALYRADIGVATADRLVAAVRTNLDKDAAASWDAVAKCLKDEARVILRAAMKPVERPASGPFVILVVGVNGVGKTTTIGKLGAHFLAADQTVLLAAADTFRAAAIEQLEVWGQRLGVDVVRHQAGSDPAAVAYDGVKAAVARQSDVLLIDTAGRLHSKTELMAELGKINRVIGKDLPGAPHETWLVIDATTGQNAVMQVKAFKEVVKLTGLIVTKLDGTAKGGVLIGIADQFKLPIHYVGVGEKAADLRAFDVDDYVESLF